MKHLGINLIIFVFLANILTSATIKNRIVVTWGRANSGADSSAVEHDLFNVCNLRFHL